MKPEPHRTISVEDLLRLKRAERPPAEFWGEFDRRLREKQLSALVAPRPWWSSMGLAGVWHGIRRFQVPLGACAIVAVTLVSWQHDQSVAVADSAAGSEGMVAALPGGEVPAAGLPEQRDAAAPVSAVAVAPEAILSADGGMPVEKSRADVVVADAGAFGLPRDIPLLGVPSVARGEGSYAWASRYEAAAGNSADVAEIQMSRSLLSSVARFEARMPPVRSPVEPLRQIAPPAERRGARILTAMVTVGSVENAMRTTERAASRLSEERLYDQIQRFGARGAGVSVKF